MVWMKLTIPTLFFAFLFALNAATISFARPSLDILYDRLAVADAQMAQKIELEIKRLWELSGSESIDFIYKKGDEAFKAKDYKAAVGHYSAVVEFAPEFPLGWYARSRAYAILGYNGPALSDLEKALALDPQNFVAIMGLGLLFEKLGHSDLSLRAFEQALEIHPNFEAVLQLKHSLAQSGSEKKI